MDEGECHRREGAGRGCVEAVEELQRYKGKSAEDSGRYSAIPKLVTMSLFVPNQRGNAVGVGLC